MTPVIGVNASPIIVLARAGHLGLLRGAAARVCVPDAVAAELRRRPPPDPAAVALATCDWLEVVPTPAVPFSIARHDLGPGESGLLAWAAAAGVAEVVVDDLAARRAAAAAGLRPRGTLSLVLAAKADGRIPAVAPVLDDIRAAGLYVSPRLVRAVLESAGERP